MYVNRCCIYSAFMFASSVAAPVVSVGSTTPTTISLSWTSAGSEVDSYEVTWERDTSGECPDVVDTDSTTIIDGSTIYTIRELEEGSSYTITMTATNAVGSEVSVPVTGVTKEAGERIVTGLKS